MSSSTSSAKTRLFLLDTNVLVSAADPLDGDRADVAAALLERVLETSTGAISPQIVAEYYALTTSRRRRQAPIYTSQQAREYIEDLLTVCRCLDASEHTAREAVRAAERYQMHIYDAHIWATAKVHGIDTILTEDRQSRAVIEGVRYVDPFARSFRPAQIGL